MAGRKNGLGRGLDAFFPDRTSVVKEPARKTITKTVKTKKKSDVAEKQTNPTVAKKQTADSKTGAMIVKISSVEPNMDQPRKQFDEDALMELSESIKQYGVLHPLLVSDKKDYYEIIAGERRWRAAKLAGLTEIPVIVKEFSEQELVEISLIENIQREDLNPVEEAMAYKRLIDEFHLKQDEIAERVGKSRTAVTNAMRLLKLSEKVQQMLIDEMITAGHARAILSIADKEKQESIAMKVFDEKLSVRETEALVKRMLEPPKTAKKSKFSSAEDAIYESLEEKMKKAAAELEFEQAAEYRDLIENVKRIGEKQKINDTGGDDRDIIAMAKAGDEAVVAIFFIRSGKLLGRDHFHMTGIGDSEKQEIITDFIKQFYVGTPFIPKEILTQEEVLDQEILEKWLSDKRGSKVIFAMPKRGSKHQMMELARKNAQNVLAQDSEKLKREERRTIGAVHELEQALGIGNLNRMEAFDISNTNGYENVASMVVFEKGKAKRSDYRKFKIKTVAGPDDYHCMEEALERRFSHGIREQKEREEKGQDMELGSFTRFPDILMMDGGKGQVNIALQVLEKLGLTIPVCGMVKDDFHRTRALYYNNEIIEFPKNSEAFRMITRLQDEAHRFAITYHKALRGKEQVHSVLDDIKGIGPARRKSLMKHFKDIGKVKEASVTELCEADGITENVAEEIYRFFHEDTSKKNGDVV